jgi:hypothetical protein
LTLVGNEVYTNTNGGVGPSERMKQVIEKKRLKSLKINLGLDDE